MANHGLRHNQIYDEGYKADTKNYGDWVVLLNTDGKPFARQKKQSHGRFYRQSITNPDYQGREGYHLQYSKDGGETWESYDDRASRGDIRYQLTRLVESARIS